MKLLTKNAIFDINQISANQRDYCTYSKTCDKRHPPKCPYTTGVPHISKTFQGGKINTVILTSHHVSLHHRFYCRPDNDTNSVSTNHITFHTCIVNCLNLYYYYHDTLIPLWVCAVMYIMYIITVCNWTPCK
jgi:hypothetical protein